MMKISLLTILLITGVFAQELEVEGSLKVIGEIDAQGNAITNVGNPTQDNDAVNLSTVRNMSGMKPDRIYTHISNNDYLITHSQHYGFIWNFNKQSQSSNLILEAEALEYIINKHSDVITKKCGINVLSDHYRFIARVYEKIKRYDLATKKYNEAFLISKYYHKNIFYKIMLSINIKYNYRIINYLRVNKVK